MEGHMQRAQEVVAKHRHRYNQYQHFFISFPSHLNLLSCEEIKELGVAVKTTNLYIKKQKKNIIFFHKQEKKGIAAFLFLYFLFPSPPISSIFMPCSSMFFFCFFSMVLNFCSWFMFLLFFMCYPWFWFEVWSFFLGFGGELRGASSLGINYGQIGDDLPSPDKVLDMLLALKITKVRIYDTNQQILSAFANSNVEIIVTVENEMLGELMDPQQALQWVATRIKPYVPATRVTGIAIGNEVS